MHPPDGGWAAAFATAAAPAVGGEAVMAGLAGTGRVADELYLLAHDDSTGRPFLHPRALGLGLAGGLLAELVLAACAGVLPGRVVLSGRARPDNALAGEVARLLAAEREQLPVGDWLAFLASTSERAVAGRLEQAGYLTRTAGPRRPWRAGRLMPADPDHAFAPMIRIRIALDPARPATVADVVLAGLAVACGLGPRILPYGPPGGRDRLEAAVRALRPDLRRLIAQTQSMTDSAVLSHRR